MPAIKLYYGPYEAHGLIKHRPQRLHGLLTCLSEKLYEVEIVPSEHVNRLTVEMEGSIIYTCDIRFLLFNMNCEDDAVCQKAIAAIEEAASRIYAESNMPTFVSVDEGRRYIEKAKHLTTKMCFNSEIDLIYEHQTQFKAEFKQEEDVSDNKYDKRISYRHTSNTDVEDQENDEYADWDFASTILRQIIDSIPSTEEVVPAVGKSSSKNLKSGGLFAGRKQEGNKNETSVNTVDVDDDFEDLPEDTTD